MYAKKDWGLCCIRPQSVLLLFATALFFLPALLFFLFFWAALLFLLWLTALFFLLWLAALTHVGHLLLGENAVGRYLLAVLQVQCFTVTEALGLQYLINQCQQLVNCFVGQSVVNPIAFSTRCHQSAGPKCIQVTGYGGLVAAQCVSNIANGHLAVTQQVNYVQPGMGGERLQNFYSEFLNAAGERSHSFKYWHIPILDYIITLSPCFVKTIGARGMQIKF